MKTYRVSGGTATLNLNLGPRWRSALNITPSRFTPKKEPLVVNQQETRRAPELVWTYVKKKKKSLPAVGIQTPKHPAHSIVS